MLKTLKISNIALIENLEINFENGFTVLTGETGAGKSIIIDALNFVLGERADKSLIRTGETQAKVQGLFSVQESPEILSVFENLGLEFENDIVILRTMSVDGKNECRINGNVATLSMLKQLTNLLVDIHGQNEHQVIMQSKNHLMLLDDFCGKSVKEKKSILESLMIKFAENKKQIEKLGGSDENRISQIEFLQFQLNELNSAKLTLGEEEELTATLKKYNNASKIKDNLQSVINVLKDGSSSAFDLLSVASNSLIALSSIDEKYGAMQERISSLKYEIEDCSEILNEDLSDLEFNQADYDKVDARLDLIKSLKRKHSKNVEELIAYSVKLTEELNMLSNSEEILNGLRKEKNELEKQIYKVCSELSSERKAGANKLEQKLTSELKSLGMGASCFKIEFQPLCEINAISENLTHNGLDNIQFMFSANFGEPLKPLIKVISGGEMSRFMLAFKTVIAESDRIPTLIFDEIDTGISGQIASVVALKIATISKSHQVISISHLPQIASYADNHFFIFKNIENNKTRTHLVLLNKNERANEIARLIGGVEKSESTIKTAQELLEQSTRIKSNL